MLIADSGYCGQKDGLTIDSGQNDHEQRLLTSVAGVGHYVVDYGRGHGEWQFCT